jgi:AraC family transcriptional regulator, transcriptional activator of the genes for pyochelin and ferripyochelin receptors
MKGFEVISPDREDILYQPVVPSNYQHLLLKGADSFLLDCSFGAMLFNHYKGDGFDLWKSNYIIDRPATVIGRADVPMLEFSVIYENSFSIDWKGVRKAVLPARQIELYHAPYMDNKTNFPSNKNFATVDFHFHKEMLDQYSESFPLLARFMEKVHKGKPAQLFDGKQFSCPSIDRIIGEMLGFKFHDELAPAYYDSYTHILLITLLERISGFNPLAQQFTATDIEKAHRARELLTTEFGQSYTIKELSKILHTNPYKLKVCFKSLFGISIGRYKKSVLMEQAKILLQCTDYTTDEIAMRLGYNSSQAFSTAFRNYFKTVPSHWRRKSR